MAKRRALFPPGGWPVHPERRSAWGLTTASTVLLQMPRCLFGAGTHCCIGAALSRMEIKIAAREIIKRLDNIQLAIPIEDLSYMPNVAMQTIERLPLTFTRREAAG